MIRLIMILTLFSISQLSFAQTNQGTSGLDLSVPSQELEYKQDDKKAGYQESEQAKQKRERCAELARQIDALRGKLKPARRSALINQHRSECQGKQPWDSGAY